MVKSIFIKLNYGPYEAHGVIRHKKQRLFGLVEHLQNESYLIVLNPTLHLNRLTVEILDREIFRCDIRNLLFNMPSYEDPLCLRIIDVIKDHESFFCSKRNTQRYVDIKEGMRWLDKTPEGIIYVPSGSMEFEITAPANSLTSNSSETIEESFDKEKIDMEKFIIAKKQMIRKSEIVELSKGILDQVFEDVQKAMRKMQPSTSKTSSSLSSGAVSFDEPTMCPCPPNSVYKSASELNAYDLSAKDYVISSTRMNKIATFEDSPPLTEEDFQNVNNAEQFEYDSTLTSFSYILDT